MGRSVYTGIYEPDHPTADEDGFRSDVAGAGPRPRRADRALPRRQLRLRVPLGGRRRPASTERPTRLDLAWRTVETNQVGVDEFTRWARQADVRADDGGQPRHPWRARGARPRSSTATIPSGTHWSDLRRQQRRRTIRTASGCGASATRWTGRGRSGHKTAHGVRPAGRRDGQGHAPASTRRSSWWPAAARTADADLRRRGRRRSCSKPTTSSTTSRCTATTSSAATTGAASWPRGRHGGVHRRDIVATSDHVGAKRPPQQADQPLLRRVERLVPEQLRGRGHASTGRWPRA